jgi:hypothetical protein
MYLDKEEFQAWMQQSTTKKIWALLREKINTDKVAYATHMGQDQIQDRYAAGMFRGFDTFLSMEDMFDFGEGEA